MGKQQKGVNGLLFYDFEVFKYDWLVVVMDMTAKKTHVIINSPEELEALYKANIKEIWVGFNSRHYDQYILKAILCGFDPKKVNDYIITKGNPGWKFSSLFRQFPLSALLSPHTSSKSAHMSAFSFGQFLIGFFVFFHQLGGYK